MTDKTISDFVREHNITAEIVKDRGSQVEDGWEHHAYIVRLLNPDNGKTIETPWRQGYRIETSPSSTPDMILDSLVSDAWSFYVAGDFEDWASEYGYDTDSRKAYATWQQVEALYPHVVNFLSGVGGLEMVATEYERL